MPDLEYKLVTKEPLEEQAEFIWSPFEILDRWLKNGRYYQLNLVAGDHQNPEYRIADDVRVATESPVEFATGRPA